jgi:hypothetical protein
LYEANLLKQVLNHCDSATTDASAVLLTLKRRKHQTFDFATGPADSGSVEHQYVAPNNLVMVSVGSMVGVHITKKLISQSWRLLIVGESDVARPFEISDNSLAASMC